MSKFIVTFGSGQLEDFCVDPLKVMLVIEDDTELAARSQVMATSVGNRFCTSYKYNEVVKEFSEKYKMQEISLDDLMELRVGRAI